MAISNKTIVGTNAAVTSAGTAVTPTIAPYDNTHTIIVYNPDGSNTIYLAFTDDSSIAEADAVFVPPQASLTLAIGAKSARPPVGDFKVDASGGTPTARITYINGTSS
jgi:hypothetical protein